MVQCQYAFYLEVDKCRKVSLVPLMLNHDKLIALKGGSVYSLEVFYLLPCPWEGGRGRC